MFNNDDDAFEGKLAYPAKMVCNPPSVPHLASAWAIVCDDVAYLSLDAHDIKCKKCKELYANNAP